MESKPEQNDADTIVLVRTRHRHLGAQRVPESTSMQASQLAQEQGSGEEHAIVHLPNDIFIEIINTQKQKEENTDIWKDSPYKDLVKLQSNNVGIVGEKFIQTICQLCGIDSEVDGSKTKELGGGAGDGLILGKSVEIKTSHRGCAYPSFQHELGEFPWKPEFMIFIDISPTCIYLTIFKNFSEETYKTGTKCEPYFPKKSVTWRKNSGAFKLDTTVKINEENIAKGYTFKIDNNVDLDDLKSFILFNIE